MKKFALLLFAILSSIALGCSQATVDNADNSMMEDEKMDEHAMMADEGFEMKDGKMVMVNMKENTETPMTKDAVLDDRTKVMTDGKVIRPDGETFTLNEGDSMWQDGMFMSADEHMDGMMEDSMEEKMMDFSYSGKVLAGTESKYLEFNQQDYEQAKAKEKKILLYFYANWCPICKAEQVHTTGAFNELKDSNLVGFRVNWRDGMDDENEIALAKEFGITSQHTKVILENGQRILKSPESWDKERYLEELA